MSKAVQNAALGVYRYCHKQGWLEHPTFQRLFQSTYFLYKRYYEDAFYPLIQRSPELFRNGHVLDIGANIGYTASLFARAISSEFRVFAFEPETSNISQLQQSLSRLNLANRVTIIQAAVGRNSGTARLWLNKDHSADHRVLTPAFVSRLYDSFESQSVPMVSIDHYVSTHSPMPIAFIKIDVQGYETAVCEGMSETLKLNPQAAVAIEYYPKGMRVLGFEPDDLLAYFSQRGYIPHWLERNRELTPTDYKTIKNTLQGEAYSDLLFRRPPGF